MLPSFLSLLLAVLAAGAAAAAQGHDGGAAARRTMEEFAGYPASDDPLRVYSDGGAYPLRVDSDGLQRQVKEPSDCLSRNLALLPRRQRSVARARVGCVPGNGM
jgi:hypothetical protein